MNRVYSEGGVPNRKGAGTPAGTSTASCIHGGKSSVLLSIVSAHGPSCLQLDTQYSRSPVTGCLHSERLSEQMSAGTSKDMRIVCAKENHRAHFYLEQGIFGFLWVV